MITWNVVFYFFDFLELQTSAKEADFGGDFIVGTFYLLYIIPIGLMKFLLHVIYEAGIVCTWVLCVYYFQPVWDTESKYSSIY